MDARGLEAREKTSAAKKLQRDDARAILEGSARVIVSKGKRVEAFDTDGAIDESVLDRFLGSTGNLRAPTVRTRDTTLVGFNEDAWAEVFG